MPRKLTIEEMHKIAANRGGLCLSEKYVNSSEKLLWKCRFGHKWKSTSHNVKSGHWCPYCAGKASSTIEEMKKIAAKHGGKCLSEKYEGQEVKLLWQCKNGHKWEAIPKHIIKGIVWCPYCAREIIRDKLRYTINEMQEFALKKGGFCISKINKSQSNQFLWQCKNGHKWVATPTKMKQRKYFCARCMGRKPSQKDLYKIAKKRGGTCLSTKYINNETKLRWRCKDGHEWEATLSMVKSGTWCPYCAKKVILTIKEMQELAAKRGGRCLSSKYINSQTKLHWECKHGHVFEASPSHIKTSKSWCPICGYKIVSEKGKYSMDEIRNLATKNGGECLSKEYNAGDKLLWRCKDGHEWRAKPHAIKNSGTWCPSCTNFVNEAFIRAIFEKIFNVKFMKCHPRWLLSGFNTRPLELDGYNEKLGVAFEYHGEQHFNKNHYFYKNNDKQNINKRRLYDDVKRKLCEEKGVKLIEIPFSIKQKDYFRYIIEQCKQKNIEINSNININYRELSLPVRSKLQEMKDIAQAKDGECLSGVYLGNSIKLLWQCKNGHKWKATPQVVKRGSWCPECRNLNRKLKKYNLFNPNQQTFL